MPLYNHGGRAQLAAALRNPDVTATVASAILLDALGTDIAEWERETLAEAVRSTFGDDIPAATIDRVLALLSTLHNNLFYTDPWAFHQIANALNGGRAAPDVWDPLTVDEMTWAVTEVFLHDPPDDQAVERFAPDVRRYIGVVLADHGVYAAPPRILAELADYGADAATSTDLAQDAYHLGRATAQAAEEYAARRLEQAIDQLTTLPLSHRDAQTWQAFVSTIRTAPQPS